MASSPVRTPGDQLDGSPQLRKSCDYCVRMKRGCDGGTPCELCTRRNKECIRSVKKRSGPAKGTKYCKRKPRKAPDFSSSSPSSWTSGAGGGASAAATANTPSGGPSAGRCPLPPGGIGRSESGSGRGGKNGVVKARPSLSKKIKHETADGAPPHAPGGAAAAAVLAAGMPPPKFKGMPTPAGAAVGIDMSPSQQHVRWRGQEYGGADGDRGSKLQPAGLGGAGGIGTHRRGSSSTAESYGSRRSSLGSIAGFGTDGGDRRCSLEADACSGSLLPFYFAPTESDGVSGGGSSGDAAWVGGDLSGGGVGGGRVVTDYGSGGGGISEAEQAAMVMAARRSSLEEALHEGCYKRASFSNAWGPPPSSTPHHHQQHPHPHPHYRHPHHRHMSSSDGMAWNQLLQQADAANHDQGQGQGHDTNNSGPGPSASGDGGGGGGGGGDYPAGGKMSASHPSAFHSPAIGAGGRAGTEAPTTSQEEEEEEQQQQQQSSTSMPRLGSVLSTFEAHYAAGGGSGGDGSSTMPSLRDLLFDTGNSDRWPPPMAPPLNEMSMVESSS